MSGRVISSASGSETHSPKAELIATLVGAAAALPSAKFPAITMNTEQTETLIEEITKHFQTDDCKRAFLEAALQVNEVKDVEVRRKALVKGIQSDVLVHTLSTFFEEDVCSDTATILGNNHYFESLLSHAKGIWGKNLVDAFMLTPQLFAKTIESAGISPKSKAYDEMVKLYTEHYDSSSTRSAITEAIQGIEGKIDQAIIDIESTTDSIFEEIESLRAAAKLTVSLLPIETKSKKVVNQLGVAGVNNREYVFSILSQLNKALKNAKSTEEKVLKIRQLTKNLEKLSSDSDKKMTFLQMLRRCIIDPMFKADTWRKALPKHVEWMAAGCADDARNQCLQSIKKELAPSIDGKEQLEAVTNSVVEQNFTSDSGNVQEVERYKKYHARLAKVQSFGASQVDMQFAGERVNKNEVLDFTLGVENPTWNEDFVRYFDINQYFIFANEKPEDKTVVPANRSPMGKWLAMDALHRAIQDTRPDVIPDRVAQLLNLRGNNGSVTFRDYQKTYMA